MNGIIQKWKKYQTDDKKLKDSLLKINNVKLPKDFDKKMPFGTAGIRGVFGAGLNKINDVTISLAAEAYAQYLLKYVDNAKTKGVVIANDNRHNGFVYRETISKIMNHHGIKVYVMPNNELMATPLLSFLIRKLKAAGGVNITASHNPKEYNGFKVYNNLGGQLMPSETQKISSLMEKIDEFEILRGEFLPEFIQAKYIDDYLDEILKIRQNNINDLSVVYSPMHGTGNKIGKRIIEKCGVESHFVEKQMIVDPNFTHTKSPNPEDSSSYKLGIKMAKKAKADIVVVTDPDADRVGVVVKHKRVFKYLNANQLAALYLEYYLSILKSKNEIPKDGYIVKSLVSTDLAEKIAKKYNIETKEVNVGFKNIADVIKNTKGTFIFGFEESYGFLINPNIARDKDAFQGIVSVIDMAAHYKKEGKDLFEQLIFLQNKYGMYRNIQKSSKINNYALKKLLNELSKTKEIHGKRVKKVIDFRKDKAEPQKMIKIFLKDGSWIVARPSGTEPKVKYYVQTVGTLGHSMTQNVIYEKKILDFLDEKAEYFPPKKFSWKTIIKYSIFVLIMIGLIMMVFRGIYSQYSNVDDTVVAGAMEYYDSKIKWFFLVLVIGMLFNVFLDAWMKYRLLRFHKQNVKLRHLIISAIMGAIISYLTPLAIGGDGIGYWYLRRKGFKKAPLAATFLSSTILWQLKNIVLTAILLPMGIHLFKDILIDGSPDAKAVIWIFLIGLIWDIFSIIMLWTIVISRRFQEWSITLSIKFLEWFSYTTITDPEGKAATYMYSLGNMRQGMRKMWKNPLVMSEAMFYELLAKLFSITALANIGLGAIKGDLAYGQYWSQIVATDVVNTANSFAITPGSTGIIEFISLHIREVIYVDDGVTGSAKDTVIHLDIINKITSQWPYLILSSFTAIFIIIGESRRKLYSTTNQNSKSDTTFYKKVFAFWPLYIAGWITFIFML